MRILTPLFIILLMMACKSKKDKIAGNEEQRITTDKKAEGLVLNDIGIDVDTSLAGVMILDSASFDGLAGKNNDFCFGETYCFISSNNEEILRLTMHPGNSPYSVSEFEAMCSAELNKKNKILPVEHFTSGKGVRLGMSKQDIVNLFGTEYKSEDSTKNFMRLNYRIEIPADTRTWLLQRYNMPIYYSIYEFRGDKLQRFKFGFEYP